MSKDPIKALIEEKFKMPRTLDLYKEFLGKTQIEIYKQEDNVIRSLMQGKSKAEIIRKMKESFPEGKFSYDDLDKFVERSDELHKVLKIDKGSVMKRWLKAKANCMEELAHLALYTKGLIPKLQAEHDNTNTLKAISTFQGILLTVMELEGFKTPGGPQINTQINLGDSKLDQLRQRMQESGHRADFVVKIDNDKVSTESEKTSENENTSS